MVYLGICEACKAGNHERCIRLKPAPIRKDIDAPALAGFRCVCNCQKKKESNVIVHKEKFHDR